MWEKVQLPTPACMLPVVSAHDENKEGSALQAQKYCALFISGYLQTDLRHVGNYSVQKRKPAHRGKVKMKG